MKNYNHYKFSMKIIHEIIWYNKYQRNNSRLVSNTQIVFVIFAFISSGKIEAVYLRKYNTMEYLEFSKFYVFCV